MNDHLKHTPLSPEDFKTLGLVDESEKYLDGKTVYSNDRYDVYYNHTTGDSSVMSTESAGWLFEGPLKDVDHLRHIITNP